ncbi:hypothetical protein M758_UG251300 [Ceratodon purpureus]|nr:hypothetical protein M758_UG251300 [Ceratodon purpureus]
MGRGRSVVLQWLSIVYARQERLHLRLPDIPEIGRMLSDSSVFNWTDECSCEARELGVGARYTFDCYLKFLDNPLYQPGSSATNPIVLDAGYEDTSNGFGVGGGSKGACEAVAMEINVVAGAPPNGVDLGCAAPSAVEVEKSLGENKGVASAGSVLPPPARPVSSSSDYDRPVGARSLVVVPADAAPAVSLPPKSCTAATFRPNSPPRRYLTLADFHKYASEEEKSVGVASTSTESMDGRLSDFYSTSATSLDSAFYSFTTRETASV